MPSFIQTCVVVVCCLGASGCVSQRVHDQALQKLQDLQASGEQTRQALQALQVSSEQTVQHLQTVLDDKDQELSALRDMHAGLEQALEVQDQLQEQQVAHMTIALEALYDKVLLLTGSSGTLPPARDIFGAEFVSIGELGRMVEAVELTVDAQAANVGALLDQNRIMQNELTTLEGKLYDAQRLHQEVTRMRRDQERQELQRAGVHHEFDAVGGVITQMAQVLEEAFGPQVIVTMHQDRLVLTLWGQALFESGNAHLTSRGQRLMTQVGAVLTRMPEHSIQIEGHTDDTPISGHLQARYPTNWELSAARATTVLRYLIERSGISCEECAATGYADTRPVETNATEAGRAQNRRVEVVLVPSQATNGRARVATLTP